MERVLIGVLGKCGIRAPGDFPAAGDGDAVLPQMLDERQVSVDI